MAASKKYITSVLSVWKTRQHPITEKYSREMLIKFIIDFYHDAIRKDKEAYTIYIRDNNIDLDNFSENDVRLAKDNLSLLQTNRTLSNSYFRHEEWLLKSSSEKASYHQEKSNKAMITRANNNKSSDITDKDAIRKSYSNAIINKGKIIAVELGLDASLLSNKELSLLSGYTKRKMHAARTEEQKNEAKLRWKRSNLKNINVKKLLITKYPEFNNVDISVAESSTIEKWYSVYVSLRVISQLLNKNSYITTNRKIVRKFSIKMNKFFTCRSSYETTFVDLLDNNELVTYFDVEPFSIKYRRDDETNDRRYLVDFIVSFSTGKALLIEIKPFTEFSKFEQLKGKYIRGKFMHPFILLDPIKTPKENIYELLEKYSK